MELRKTVRILGPCRSQKRLNALKDQKQSSFGSSQQARNPSGKTSLVLKTEQNQKRCKQKMPKPSSTILNTPQQQTVDRSTAHSEKNLNTDLAERECDSCRIPEIKTVFRARAG